MPFACIFVPNFSAAAIFRAEPELRAQALAIFEGKSPLEKVFAVNESAGRVGIAPGMTKAQAELCSELTLRPRSPSQESAAHAALLDCAQSFSPYVEDAAADTAILDLAGMESLFGSLPEIAHNLLSCAADLGLEVNVAAASNADAAVLVGFEKFLVNGDGVVAGGGEGILGREAVIDRHNFGFREIRDGNAFDQGAGVGIDSAAVQVNEHAIAVGGLGSNSI